MERGSQRAFLVLALASVLALSIFTVSPQETVAHFPSGYIYSRWDSVAPIVDGQLNLTEWQNSSLIDLSLVETNTLDTYLYVKNNNTHLFIAFDAVEDIVMDSTDIASLAFDGDHDGAPTTNGDHEFSIRGGIDASCTGFTSAKCHFVYSQATNRWRANDPMDQGLPYQSGLDAAIGFDSSSNSPIGHRIYEFSIPIELLGRPVKTISIGDTVGFYVGRHPLPAFGVWDAFTGRHAYWPERILEPSEYGNLVLGAPANVALNPEFAAKPVRASETVDYTMKVHNTGNEIDSFDLQATSSQGWSVLFLDALHGQLNKSGGDPTLPEVGPILPGEYADIIVEIIPNPSAAPGTFDLTEIRAYPFRDPSSEASATIRTGVPYEAPWIDSLELGTEAWHIFQRPVNDWEMGTPVFSLGPPGAHSGTNAFGTKLDSNYNVCSNSILYTPYVEIPDWVAGARLTFWHWYDIVPNQQDGGWIELSIDGSPWQFATPEGGYPNAKSGGDPAYAGSSGGWLQAEMNLSAHKGSSVGFRFRFWDYAELIGAIPFPDKRAPGWYLDDFEISVIGLPVDVEVSPEYQYKVGLRSTEISYELFVKNTGEQSDTFDLMIVNSTLDWDVEFYDSAWNPFMDTESPPDGYRDTGRMMPGSEVIVRVNVIIPGDASPGDKDTKLFVARSSNNESVFDSATIEAQTPFTLPFFDDMETGPDLWVTTSHWHLAHNESFAPAWNLSYSGEYAWWYGLDVTGDYDDGFRNYGSLTSPPIDLTDSVAAELTFKYWYETENSLDSDQRWLIVKTGNNPWPDPGQSGTIQFDLRQNGTWLDWTTNLSAFGGKIVQVRFFFDTMNNIDNDFQGWYVDDFLINQTIARNNPPTVSIESPSGGESWTGGSNHNVTWSAFDSRDSPADMVVWLNYSPTGEDPWFPLSQAQGIPADSTPLSMTLPIVNSTNLVMKATVVDTGGLESYDISEKFEIDSKPPEVSAFSPQGNDVRATGSVVVMFDEMMNRDSLASSFSFVRTDTWEEVLGDLYATNQSIFFDPLYNLEYGTQYMVNITELAKDDSSPGNALVETFSWTFRTNTTVNEVPVITTTSPFPGASWTGGSEQLISWVASDFEDPTGVLDVWLNYSSSTEGPWIPIAAAQGIGADSSPFNWSVPLVNMSAAVVNATVKDSRGAWSFNHSQTFEIDSAAPTITSYSPMGLDPVPVSADVRVTFSEGMAEYSVEMSFTLVRLDSGSEVIGTFSWEGNTMIFKPYSLSPGIAHKAEMDDGPKDDSIPGNLLAHNYSWVFQTETGDIIPPKVVDTVPDNNQVDVSVSITSITITFNESMYWNSVAIALTITPQVPYALTWANTSLVITLNELLDYDKGYVIRIDGSVARDPSNNLLDGDGDGTPGDDFIMNFWTEESGPAEAWDILPLASGLVLVILVMILLFVLYFLKGKRGPGEEEEKEPEEEVEKELREIDEILGIEED